VKETNKCFILKEQCHGIFGILFFWLNRFNLTTDGSVLLVSDFL